MDSTLSQQLHDLGHQALAQWGLTDAGLRLIAYRENAVFEVSQSGRRLALRLHRPGYMGPDALRSELDWLRALSQAGVPVPLPVPMPDGSLLAFVGKRVGGSQMGGRHASMLTWVVGAPLGQSKQPLGHSLPDQRRIFHALGRSMAALHLASDAWAKPTGFTRHAWDAEGLIGDSPLWGRFWDSALLDKSEARALRHLRDQLAKALPAAARLDFGLIHADLVRENVMVDAGSLRFIDFDDAGHGWRLFDVATALLPNLAEPAADLIAQELLAGYQGTKPLEGLELLPMFLVLRALTYVGWFASRPEVDPSGARLQGHIARALAMAERWNAGWAPLGASI